jgi:tRNA(fMet)-specific endonuclease VapC
LREQYACAMSSITLFELQAGATTEQKQQDIEKLCKWIDVLAFDAACADIAGQIFRDLKSRNAVIEFRDIFIGATAKYYQLDVASLNAKHFDRIDGIHLLNLANLNRSTQ